jgi:hypothetical protein
MTRTRSAGCLGLDAGGSDTSLAAVKDLLHLDPVVLRDSDPYLEREILEGPGPLRHVSDER